LNPLRILFLTAEAAPLAKVGGLADVAGSLPRVLNTLPEKLDIRLALPFYPHIKGSGIDLHPAASFTIAHEDWPLHAEVYEGDLNGVPLYLIDGEPIAQYDSVYSTDNVVDGTKFTFFSLAALELCRILDWAPDILHAHDWHSSSAVYKLSLIRNDDAFYRQTKSLLTVHNLPYQGQGSEAALQDFGLPRAHKSPLPEWAEGLPLPLGLLTADKINTVSPGYAEEMLIQEFGANLEDFLYTRKLDLSGILNGLDQEIWDPKPDPELPFNYSGKNLSDRKKNKPQLQEELGFPQDPDIPLLAMINLMDYQKGVDLVPDALQEIEDLEWQAVILGTGDPALEKAARDLDAAYSQVRAITEFSAPLAHKIYGGADLIIIPSRYEPCGLTQMIGMRYGCVPLARATGGLKDTIIDYHGSNSKRSNGFLYNDASSHALADCLRRALEVYQDQRRWGGLQRRGIKEDFSWKTSASNYLSLYKQMVNKTN